MHREVFICLASEDCLNAYALGLCGPWSDVRFGSLGHSGETEVPIRKNRCSRFPGHRHSSCSRRLNAVRSLKSL